MSQISNEIVSATSTVDNGNMSFRFGDAPNVVDNRRRFLQENGADYADCVCMACDHGEKIIAVSKNLIDSKHFGTTTQADMLTAEVLVTQDTNLPLMLLTADCIPGIFYDPKQKVIALAHLNRHTITYDLGRKTVDFLTQKYGSDPKDLCIQFGPHIQVNSYRFTAPLENRPSPQLADFILKDGKDVKIDLCGAFKHQISKAGAPRENITVSQSDTAASSRYFSHYRSIRESHPEGRMATIAMLTASEDRADSAA